MDTPTTITGPEGPLEALLTTPRADALKPGIAVFCHPHPQHGGTMNNKVVHTLSRAYLNQGISSVRFNYRGVGQSAGSFGHYEGEYQDCLAVIEWTKNRFPNQPLYVAGFSFGAYIALRAATHQNHCQHLITVAPAITSRDFTPHQALVSIPWLIPIGDKDELISPQTVSTWAKTTSAQKAILIPEADHFFHRKLLELREPIEAFIRDSL